MPATQAAPNDNPNADLDEIPLIVLDAHPGKPSALPPSSLQGRAFLENAFTAWLDRSNLRVPAPGDQPGYEDRLSLDAEYTWKPADVLSVVMSDRFNAYAGDTISVPSAGNLRNDFREGYASWAAGAQTFVEVGRINLKNGTALGYNPTDYFKSRTQVDLASIDPSASKQDRLGVLMAEGQEMFNGGAFTAAFAPGLEPVAPLLNGAPRSFDPRFAQTNSMSRGLASLSWTFAGLSPEVLVFHGGSGTQVGASLSRVMSTGLVTYAEWSGGGNGSLSDRALAFGKATGTFSADAPDIFQFSSRRAFDNDAAIGGSWTTSAKITLSLEFQYHQSGFSQSDFDRAITLGHANGRLADELWFIRRYAEGEGEPLMRQKFFVRMDWQDAFFQYLDLGGVAFVNPADGSTLAQVSMQYFLSKRWTVGIYAAGAFGGANSEEGSLPWSNNAVIQIVRYF